MNRTRKTTLVLVTHDPELAAVADVAIALRDPRSAEHDTGGGGGGVQTFVMKMLARELRSSWQRLLFFFVCVAIRVGAIVALRSVIRGMHRPDEPKRSIIASDVLISTNRPWTDDVLRGLDDRPGAAT